MKEGMYLLTPFKKGLVALAAAFLVAAAMIPVFPGTAHAVTEVTRIEVSGFQKPELGAVVDYKDIVDGLSVTELPGAYLESNRWGARLVEKYDPETGLWNGVLPTEVNVNNEYEFQAGKYRVQFRLTIPTTDYAVADDVQVILDGVEVESDVYHSLSWYDLVYFYTPVFTIPAPVNEVEVDGFQKPKVNSEATYDDLVRGMKITGYPGSYLRGGGWGSHLVMKYDSETGSMEEYSKMDGSNKYKFKAGTYNVRCIMYFPKSDYSVPEDVQVTYGGAAVDPSVSEEADYWTVEFRTPEFTIDPAPEVTSIHFYDETHTTYANDERTWTGKTMTPTLYIKDAEGNVLSAGTDYTYTKQSSRKNVGRHYYTVTFKGEYEDQGSCKAYFKINPKGTSCYTPTAYKGGKSIKAKWAKRSTKMSSSRISGYEVKVYKASDPDDAVIKKVSGYKNTSKKISGLEPGTKYRVKVRTYKYLSGNYYYSAWSSYKTVTTKKK